MATPVEVPKLGNTVEECLISSWLKHAGDRVTAGDVIADIETDKTTFEITAPVDGEVLVTLFPEGALVPVHATICVIGAPGEAHDGAVSPRPPAVGNATVPAAAIEGPGGPGEMGANGRAPGTPERVSPRARRFARRHGLEVADVRGTGPGGRLVEADLRPAAQARGRSGYTAGAPASSPASPGSPGPLEVGDVSVVPMSPVRRRIAKRLRESLASTVQYTLSSSADARALLAVRKRMKASPATAEVNINGLVVYCAILALREIPSLNAHLVDGALRLFPNVDIGFACDTERGLVVPVVRRAEELSLVGLARRLNELAEQAAAGTIAVGDINGGTFTVSNLGSLGIETFTPVLNPPQVAILGVGSTVLKPSRKADGNLEFIDSINLSLTLDHQAVDGAPGARFLKVVREKIEHIDELCTT